MVNTTLLESAEQSLLVEYLELLNLKFTAIPNSTYTKSWKQKRHNHNQGLRKGFPDMAIIIKSKLIFIEMKRTKGGIVGDEQKEWIDGLNNCDGVDAYICYGFDEAKKIIDKYVT